MLGGVIPGLLFVRIGAGVEQRLHRDRPLSIAATATAKAKVQEHTLPPGTIVLTGSMRYIKVITMKTARLFTTGRSKAVRIPKAWVEGVHEMEMEHKGGKIVLSPKKVDLWDVAEACREKKATIKRLPQTRTGVRVKF